MYCVKLVYTTHIIRSVQHTPGGRATNGSDVTHSTLVDGACACSYENLP